VTLTYSRTELLAGIPVLVARNVLRDYDREILRAQEGYSEASRQRAEGAAEALRLVLAYLSGSLSVYYPELGLNADWFPTLRAFLEAQP
jgi:hypothetical protein